MKRVLFGIIVFFTFVNTAQAVTYFYSGEEFVQVFGDYDTTMSVTGSITTSSPIPPNSVDFDISTIATQWSFSDGVQTIDNLNGVFHNAPDFAPKVQTDAAGNITSALITVAIAPLATVVNELDSLIGIFPGFGDQALKDGVCTSVIAGACTGYGFGVNDAVSNTEGSWTVFASAEAIPSLSIWALFLLILLLGILVYKHSCLARQ